jgi:hypothetical protein
MWRDCTSLCQSVNKLNVNIMPEGSKRFTQGW